MSCIDDSAITRQIAETTVFVFSLMYGIWPTAILNKCHLQSIFPGKGGVSFSGAKTGCELIVVGACQEMRAVMPPPLFTYFKKSNA